MATLRLWIAMLAAVSFLAGTGAGVLLGLALAPPPPDPGPFADYEVLFSRRFELSPDRRRGLRGFLERYQRDIDDLKSRQMEAVQDELRDIGLVCRRRIRDHVLPPGRRAEFDELVAGSPSPLPQPNRR